MPADGGIKRRGDCHLLMVGDPGTGKSQLMRFMSLLLPRAVSTNAVNTTAAGLTCSLTHRDGEAALDPGALVLADRSMCLIDEFNSMRKEDVAAMHEVMEQQTVSAAKAGITGRLNARCSIIAACNPKGKVGTGADLPAITGIGDALLSRFDLVFALTDANSPSWDRRLASFVLQRACRPAMSRYAALVRQQETRQQGSGAGTGEGGHRDCADHSQGYAAAARPAPTVDALLSMRAWTGAANEPSLGAAGLLRRPLSSAGLERQARAYADLTQSGGLGEVTLREVAAHLPPEQWRDSEGRRVEDAGRAVLVRSDAVGEEQDADSGDPLQALRARIFNPNDLPSGVDRLKAQREFDADTAQLLKQLEQHAASTGTVSGGTASALRIVASLPRLSAYVQRVKTLTPSLSPHAGELIVQYYTLQRHAAATGSGAATSRSTVRMLEAVMRLAQAHAKLCSRSQALIQVR